MTEHKALIPFPPRQMYGTFRVIAWVNPVEQRWKEFFFTEGTTLGEVLEHIQPDPAMRPFYSIFIEEHFISHANYRRIKPKANTTVYAKARVEAAAAVALLGSIAGAAAAESVALATFLGMTAGSFGMQVVGAIIATAITALGGMLFAPSAPKFNYQSQAASPSESPTLSITSARNDARQYGVIPLVLGKHKQVPPYGGSPYTEVVGDDQFLRFIVIWGYGPLRVTDIKIGDTPIEDYDDVEIETREGRDTDDPVTLYPNIGRQEDFTTILSTSFQTRRTPIETDEIGLTYTFTQGLVNFEGATRTNASVRIIGEYQEVGAGSWTAWFDETITDSTAELKRVARRVVVDRGQYDVRLRRYAEESTDSTVRDIVAWTALRSFQNEDPINFTNLARSAIRIKASDQLNGIIDQLNGIVEAEVPAYDGSNWDTDDYSRNPADLYRYVLTCRANHKAIGVTSVDDTSLAEWWDFCNTKNFKYDRIIDIEMSVQDLLDEIAQSGRAARDCVDGKWGVIIDKERDTIVDHFTPRNTWNYVGERIFSSQPHGFRVQFINADRDYRQDERIVYDDGYDAGNATEFERLSLAGITDPDNVYQHARYMIALNRLRPEYHRFNVAFDHLRATRGDRISLNHDVPLIGLGYGRVASVVGQSITLDDEVTMETGKSYSMRFHRAEGTLLRNVVLNAGTQTVVALNPADSDTTTPAAGDMYLFGEMGQESLDLIIHSIIPRTPDTAEIVAQPYSPAVFNADVSIPSYTTILSEQQARTPASPLDPIITDLVSDEKALSRMPDGSVIPGIDIYYRAGTTTSVMNVVNPVGIRARWKRTGSEQPWRYTSIHPFDNRIISIQGVEPREAYDLAIQASAQDGTPSNWVAHSNHVVIGGTTEPDDIESVSISTIGDHTYLEWEYSNPPIDVVRFEIRYHPNIGVRSWGSMIPIAPNVPKESRSFTLPSRYGTYAIKAVDFLQLKSVNAKYADTTMGDPAQLNVVETVDEHTGGFAGGKTDVVVDSTGLYLDQESNGDYITYGVYEFDANTVDLTEIYTSRISVNVGLSSSDNINVIADWATLAEVETMAGENTGDAHSAIVQIAYADDTDSAGPIWTDWQNLVVGDYTARYLKFRAILRTTDVLVSPVITTLTVAIDMPDRVASGEDISSGAGAKNITFSPAFKSLKSVTVNAQNMNKGDYWVITSKSRTGFTITFYDSTDTAVDRTFDYQAVGYGRESGT